jgi:ATP-dependent Lhr-like helicase
MQKVEFWTTPSTKQFIRDKLPDYRLSKFQNALPDDYSLEMINNYLLNIPGTINFISSQI